jgi:hypothetical protein
MGKIILVVLAVAICGVLAWAKDNKQLAEGLRQAQAKDFLVTSGDVYKKDGRLMVDDKMMRAVLKTTTPQKATVNFTYIGPSKYTSRLQNGDVRHQFGLKMASKNECNLVYVMWDFDAQRIRVSVKSNPGMCTFNECRDGGYIGLPSVAAPAVKPGEAHSLRADLDGTDLTVYADDLKIHATLPEAAAGLSGPLGLRSDNAAVAFDLTVGGN